MTHNKAEVNIGGGFLGLLTIVFIVLKLTEVINWSWWWVLAPIWIPWAILIAIGLLIGGIYLTYTIFNIMRK